MAARGTGFALLGAASVQEAHDLALEAQVATLEARVPFVHFMDGFRTSHEVNTLEMLSGEQIRAMVDDDLGRAHRQRALSRERPVTRATSHNPANARSTERRVGKNFVRMATPQGMQ